MNGKNKKVPIDASDINKHSKIFANMNTKISIGKHHKGLLMIIKEFMQRLLH